MAPANDVATTAEERERVFPADFAWGVATAAHQIEGSTEVDGRGQSIWDVFAKVQGRVSGGATADVASNHYRLFESDIALLRSLGIRHYQFSIAWPRVQPTGRGPACHEGLEFYGRVVDCCVRHGIEPIPTLYHWDLPLALQLELFGWASPEIVPLFADYAREVFRALGRRGVRRWVTLHEPWCTAVMGHSRGLHAPGVRSGDPATVYRVGYHLLLAHAAAVRVFREELQLDSEGGQIGITLSADWAEPAQASDMHARTAELVQDCSIGWFAGPIFTGDYPATMRAHCGSLLPEFGPEERALLAGSADFVCLRHRLAELVEVVLPDTLATCDQVCADDDLWRTASVELSKDRAWPLSDTQEPITPWALRKVLLWFRDRFRPRGGILVTGPGLCSRARQTELDDPDRVQFLHEYIGAVHDAMVAGADVRGYFATAFLDGFEWQEGYDVRSGLVHVDFATQRRSPKASARWFSRTASENALAAHGPPGTECSHGPAPPPPQPSPPPEPCGPLWWVSQPVGVTSEQAAPPGGTAAAPEAADGTTRALLELLRGNSVESDAHAGALAELDPETVICMLDAVERHVEACSGPSEKAVDVSPEPPPNFGELLRIADSCAAEVEVARTSLGRGVEGVPPPAPTAADTGEGWPAAEARCARWSEAIRSVAAWKSDQLGSLRGAGAEGAGVYAEVAALDPAALAAPLLLLEDLRQSMASPALERPEEHEAGSIEPMWWVSPDHQVVSSLQRAPPGGSQSGGAGQAARKEERRRPPDVCADTPTLALLNLFRGATIDSEDQGAALSELDPNTMCFVIEAVERHVSGIPCDPESMPASDPTDTSVVQEQLLEVALAVAEEVERARAVAAYIPPAHFDNDMFAIPSLQDSENIDPRCLRPTWRGDDHGRGAVFEAEAWKRRQVDLLEGAGPAAVQHCAQVAKLSPLALAAAATVAIETGF